MYNHLALMEVAYFSFCRFDQTAKDEILAFLIGSALRYSAYAKVGLDNMFIHAIFCFILFRLILQLLTTCIAAEDFVVA